MTKQIYDGILVAVFPRHIINRGDKAMNEQIRMLERLTNIQRHLEDLNSSYPATAEFLKEKGVTNVRELDEQGRAELVSHLQACAGVLLA